MDRASEHADVVFVPRRPARLIRPDDARGRTDEVDVVLDDLFGEEDPAGPGTTDAVLVAVGVVAVGVGQLADMPGAVTVAGLGLAGLGLILPLRSVFRRVADRRRRSRRAELIGDGIPLRQDDEALRELASLHDRVHDLSARLAPGRRSDLVDVAHALVDEVATLLGGARPRGAAEVDYVAARRSALAELVAAVEDPRVGDGETTRRQALAQARLEIEAIAGTSALEESAALLDELRPDTDA